MAARLSLEIEFGDREDDLFVDANTTWSAEGLDPEDIPHAAVQATMALMRMRIADMMRADLTFANEEILQRWAETEARLAVLHMVMHVEAPPPRGIETSY